MESARNYHSDQELNKNRKFNQKQENEYMKKKFNYLPRHYVDINLKNSSEKVEKDIKKSIRISPHESLQNYDENNLNYKNILTQNSSENCDFIKNRFKSLFKEFKQV